MSDVEDYETTHAGADEDQVGLESSPDSRFKKLGQRDEEEEEDEEEDDEEENDDEDDEEDEEENEDEGTKRGKKRRRVSRYLISFPPYSRSLW